MGMNKFIKPISVFFLAPYLVVGVLQNASSGEKNNNNLTFMLKDGGCTQTLIVDQISKNKIHFRLNLAGTCKKNISGIAVLASDGPDLENEEDENGEMYPAVAYDYTRKDGYELGLSIAFEGGAYKRDKAIVAEVKDMDGCPVIIKTMRLVK